MSLQSFFVFTVSLQLLSFLFTPCASLYWLLTSEDDKCFIEEVPLETLVVVTYTSLDHHTLGNGQRMLAVVTDPFGSILSEQMLEKETGKIAFSSEHSGIPFIHACH